MGQAAALQLAGGELAALLGERGGEAEVDEDDALEGGVDEDVAGAEVVVDDVAVVDDGEGADQAGGDDDELGEREAGGREALGEGGADEVVHHEDGAVAELEQAVGADDCGVARSGPGPGAGGGGGRGRGCWAGRRAGPWRTTGAPSLRRVARSSTVRRPSRSTRETRWPGTEIMRAPQAVGIDGRDDHAGERWHYYRAARRPGGDCQEPRERRGASRRLIPSIARHIPAEGRTRGQASQAGGGVGDGVRTGAGRW